MLTNVNHLIILVCFQLFLYTWYWSACDVPVLYFTSGGVFQSSWW